jgi:hypothetical protein
MAADSAGVLGRNAGAESGANATAQAPVDGHGRPETDGGQRLRSRIFGRGDVVYGALALTGISFWFLLGFPYANHNESFAIVAQLRNMGLPDALTQILYPVANYRPLGQAIAWIGYQPGGTIFPVEAFNYVGAVAAWTVLFVAMRERKVFALTAMVAGGVFFTGYIYLFHLHGVFYSPLLLLVAMLFWVDRELTRSRLMILTLCALLTAFFHPYGLLVYLLGLGGMVLERRGSLAGIKRVTYLCLSLALLLFVVLVFFQRRTSVDSMTEMYDGLLVSYEMVEINMIATLAALCLAVVTSLSLPGAGRIRYGSAITAAIVGLLLMYSEVPVLFLWIGVCLLKTLLMRKWWVALVLCCTALFPAPTATGSPTYVVFVLMVCAAVLPMGWTQLERSLGAPARVAASGALAVALTLLVLLRVGIDVPVISNISRPILAEREKTFQMEEIVEWLLASEYAGYDPVLVQEVRPPSDATDSVDRTFRPPTNQKDLTMYVHALRGSSERPLPGGKSVLVGFGGQTMPPGEEILTLTAPHAGQARVVLSDR